MTSTEAPAITTTQVYRVYIKATADAIWTAITDPEWTNRYGYSGYTHYDLQPGGALVVPEPGDVEAPRPQRLATRARRAHRRRGDRGRPAAPPQVRPGGC